MKHPYITRLVAITLFLIPLSQNSFAEVINPKDTVYGTVVDKNGEPLPGAKVSIIGQSHSAFTDIDGRFNIKCQAGAKKIRVSYPKLRDVKRKIHPDMSISIGRSWRQVPERYQWFFGPSIGVGVAKANMEIILPSQYGPHRDAYDKTHFGSNISIMTGRVKAVGWYLKGFFTPDLNRTYSSEGIIIGGMLRLGCPLHLYIGGGASNTKFSKVPSKFSYDTFSYQVDMGLLFRLRDNIGINCSMNIGTEKKGNYLTGSFLNLGLLYFFDS